MKKREFDKKYKGKPKPNLVKIGTSYTVEDLARLLKVCKQYSTGTRKVSLVLIIAFLLCLMPLILNIS